jgi:hypothetical protein
MKDATWDHPGNCGFAWPVSAELGQGIVRAIDAAVVEDMSAGRRLLNWIE